MSAVRGQLQVFQLWSCGAVVSSLTRVFRQCRAKPLCLAVQALRQWPCEAVVSSVQVSGSGRAKPLCLRCASPPAVAVRGGCTLSLLDELFSGRGRARQSVFCSSLRQWPCEAVVFPVQAPAVAVRGGCVFAEQALRQRLGEAVVRSLNESSGSGRLRPLLGFWRVAMCERHASNPPACGRLRLNPEFPVCILYELATR